MGGVLSALAGWLRGCWLGAAGAGDPFAATPVAPFGPAAAAAGRGGAFRAAGAGGAAVRRGGAGGGGGPMFDEALMADFEKVRPRAGALAGA